MVSAAFEYFSTLSPERSRREKKRNETVKKEGNKKDELTSKGAVETVE